MFCANMATDNEKRGFSKPQKFGQVDFWTLILGAPVGCDWLSTVALPGTHICTEQNGNFTVIDNSAIQKGEFEDLPGNRYTLWDHFWKTRHGPYTVSRKPLSACGIHADTKLSQNMIDRTPRWK